MSQKIYFPADEMGVVLTLQGILRAIVEFFVSLPWFCFAHYHKSSNVIYTVNIDTWSPEPT